MTPFYDEDNKKPGDYDHFEGWSDEVMRKHPGKIRPGQKELSRFWRDYKK